jgi:hypothetical protein
MTVRENEQVPTVPCRTTEIMRNPYFARGLADIRAGHPFADLIEDPDGAWDYERGRLFGAIAPASMPLLIGKKKLNSKVVALFNAACQRRLIT